MLIDKQISSDQIKVHASKQIEKQKLFLGKLKRHPGQTVYELNVETGKISPVVFDQTKILLNGEVHHEIIHKEDSLYTVAINVENAKRKFRKQIENLLK